MAYSDFSLDDVRKSLGVTIRLGRHFAGVVPCEVPLWLTETLARNMDLPLLSEKSRSEAIVLPILVGARELSGKRFTVFSGQNLPGDPARGLTGECDFILARTPSLPLLSAPLVTIVEAKKSDVDLGLGQCAAQMVGARLFNEREGSPADAIRGCVTTGDDWVFLELRGNDLIIDLTRYYLRDLGLILAILQAITA